jgi:hypothetical protein
MNCKLGNLDLTFEPSGKLAALSLAGGSSWLAATPHREEMAPGRFFEPRGWDECFPSIEAYGDVPIMGDLIWQAPELAVGNDEIVQVWRMSAYHATRCFRAPDPQRLEMCFQAKNVTESALPFLWASHTLFSITGLKSVTFADGERLDEFSLDGSSSKSFKPNDGPVRLERVDCEILLGCDQPWWGIWNNRGGWPASRAAGFGALGLEATTTDSDSPGSDIIPPGGAFYGTVTLEVKL